MDVDLDLGDGPRLRVLAAGDATALAEATSGEPGRALWGPYPVGPYSLRDARTALAAWDPAAGGQFCLGILRGRRLLGGVGLMPDSPGSIELAYWVRPEERARAWPPGRCSPPRRGPTASSLYHGSGWRSSRATSPRCG